MKKLFFIIGCTTLITACATTQAVKVDDTITVSSSEVEEVVLETSQNFTFISKPYYTSDLSFRVGGQIDKFDLHSGSYYRKGDLIAGIDQRDFIIKKERAEAVYNQAQAEADRIEILYKKDNISASIYEKAKADCAVAKTSFQTASNELTDTRLLAPFNGYVGEVNVEKFQEVKSSQTVISFVELDRLKIEAYIPQNIAYAAQKLQNVSIVFDVIPNKSYEAKVLEVSKSTTPNNLSYLLTAELNNKSGELLAGMSGKVCFDIKNTITDTALTVPVTAVCNSPSIGNYVWKVDTETMSVKINKITTGELRQGGNIIVKEGLDKGDVVATSGHRFLSEKVNIKLN